MTRICFLDLETTGLNVFGGVLPDDVDSQHLVVLSAESSGLGGSPGTPSL